MADLKVKFPLFIMWLAVLACTSIIFMPIDCEAKSKRNTSKPYTPPYAHMIMDADTGIIISQENADKTLYPASLTKLMTLLLTFEALDARKISLSSPVTMTRHAASMPPSKIGLRPGQSLSIENAIKALVTKSANDVAVALGEKLGGDRFAQMMNIKARQIGMNQSNFVNAAGLHNSRQTSSARDMAKLALYILRYYPHYYSVFSMKEFYFNGKSYHNHNRLMSSYRGMDGMKTGYISQSGFNLVASAKRNNVRLIGVIFGGKTANSRNAQMEKLLDNGFAKIGQLRHMNPQIASIPPTRTPTPILRDSAAPAIVPPRKPTDIAAPPVSVGEIPPQASYLSKPFNARIANAQSNAIPSAAVTPPENEPKPISGWSIQIGAFQDRVSTDQALYRALQKLPSPLNRGSAQIVPLRTSDATWVFRARIGGYTKEQALQACRYLDECLTISPSAN